VGASVAAGLGWRPGLAALVLAVAALALVATFLRVPASHPRRAAGPGVRGAAGRLPRKYWLAWGSLLATGSIEVSINLWIGDVLRVHAGASPGTATAALSAIVGGMFVGRLIGVRLLLHFAAPKVLLAALGVSAAGFTLFWLATAPWLAMAGLLVCGLGNALHYPLGVAIAVDHSGGQPDLAAARTAYAMGLSFGLAPILLGAVADRVGPHPAFLLVYAMLALSAAAVLRLLALARHGDAVGQRKQDGVDPAVGGDHVVELDDRPVGTGFRGEDVTAA
jgi:fucose permease